VQNGQAGGADEEELVELMNAITNSDRFSTIPKIVKERGEGSVFTIMFDEAEARGIAKGEARGAIKEAIKIYHDDLHLSPMMVLQKIIYRFSLQETDARKYVEETLGVTLGESSTVLAEPVAAYDPGEQEEEKV